jgi:hypothetical protein
MSSDNSAETAVAVRDSEESFRPILRWGRGQYVFPKEKAIVAAKEAMKVSLAEFVSFMTTGTSPSRSPEKWRKFVTHNNYGVVAVDEGKYPFVVFDVEGHPQMKEVIHFLPLEPAAKLLPAIHEAIKDDPEAHGIKIKTARTPESKAKHQARLDNLIWKPEDCVSSQNKSGTLKPTQPNPMSNKWVHVPTAFQVKWCCVPEKDNKSAKKSGSSKRKDRDLGEALPAGVRIKTDVDFPGISLMASIPVGSSYTTKVIDGQLQVVVYGTATATEEAEEEDAGEVGDEDEERE